MLGKDLAQQFDDLKILQGFMLPSGAFFLAKGGDKNTKMAVSLLSFVF